VLLVLVVDDVVITSPIPTLATTIMIVALPTIPIGREIVK
jgi:hypothetical protein